MADTNYLEEIWLTIQDYPDYSISNLGNVRRDAPSRHPRGRAKVGHILKHGRCGIGMKYAKVALTGLDGRMNHHTVHKLVCTAFHGPKPSPRHQVAHNDGDPLNNCSNNLRWATAEENSNDKRTHGTHLKGSTVPGSRLTEQQVTAIRELDIPATDVARILGMEQSTINKIRRGKLWSWLE